MGSQYGEFDDDDFMGGGGEGGLTDLSERLTSTEGGLRGSKDASKDRVFKPPARSAYKTWSHSNAFMAPFAAQQGTLLSTPPNLGPLSIGSTSVGSSPNTNSPPSSAPATPLSSSSSGSPFPQPIARPRMMSMPPQVPRPPTSASSGQMTPPSSESAQPSRVPSRASQSIFAFPGQPPMGEPLSASTSPTLVSPTAQERAAALSDSNASAFQSIPTRVGGVGQMYSGTSSGSSVGSGTGSRRTTPHTSPTLGSRELPSFSTRPSSPFEFGLPISAVEGSAFSTGVAPSSVEKEDKPARIAIAGLPPVPGSRLDSRLKVVRSLNITSPASSAGSPMSHTASLSILSSLASTTSPSVPVTPNSTSFFSSHSPMSQAGGSQPNSADSNSSSSRLAVGASGRFYTDQQDEGARPRSVSNPVEPYQLVAPGHITAHGAGVPPSGKRPVVAHQRHHSSSATQHDREQQQLLQPQQPQLKADFDHRIPQPQHAQH